MVRSDLPTLDFGMMRDDPLPPEDVKLIGMLVQYPLFKLPQQLESLIGIGGSALLFIEIV